MPLLFALDAHSTIHAAACDGKLLILLVDVAAIKMDGGMSNFQNGIETVLERDSLEGKFSIYKIRDKSVEAVGQTCIDSIPIESPKQSGPSGDVLAPIKGWFDSSGAADADRRKLRQNVSRLQNERRNLAADLLSDLKRDTPSSGVKDLLSAIISVIQSECEASKDCELFIFSDLRDSRTKLLNEGNRPQSADYFRSMGIQDAEIVRRNLNAQKPRNAVNFRIWGQDLGGDEQRKLTQYWVGALSTFNPSTAPAPDIRMRFGW